MSWRYVLASLIALALFLQVGSVPALLLVVCGVAFGLVTAFVARLLLKCDAKAAFFAAEKSFILTVFSASLMLLLLSLAPFESMLGVSLPLTVLLVFVLGFISGNSYFSGLSALASQAGWRIYAAYAISIVLCIVVVFGVLEYSPVHFELFQL